MCQEQGQNPRAMNVETDTSTLTLRAQNDPKVQRTKRAIRPPSFSPFGLLGNIKHLSQHTDLIYALSVHRIKIRYKQSVLGIAWALLQPLSLMLIYTFIFSISAELRLSGRGLPVSYGVPQSRRWLRTASCGDRLRVFRENSAACHAVGPYRTGRISLSRTCAHVVMRGKNRIGVAFSPVLVWA